MTKFLSPEDVPAQLPTAPFIFRNQEPIAQRLAEWLNADDRVLEIASGRGQHCGYWSWRLPELGLTQLQWQPTEQHIHLHTLQQWYAHCQKSVVRPPIELDVNHKKWNTGANANRTESEKWNAMVAVNFSHFVDDASLQNLFSGAVKHLGDRGLLMLYGPVNYRQTYTSEGNRQLDQWLRQDIPGAYIKDIEQIETLAESAGLSLIADQPMPSNNRWLVFQ